MRMLVMVLCAVVFSGAAELKWQGFADGIAIVKAKKKPAILDFYTDWCHWCKVMDQKTFNETKVNALLKKEFVTMRINPEKSKEKIKYDGKEFAPMEFAQALGVQGFPAIAFFDNTGKVITLLPGYIPPETFIQILSYVKDECYAKGMPFEEYQKKVGKCK